MDEINKFLESYVVTRFDPPVNLFRIAGFPRRETVWSNMLKFYFDNEHHRMNGFLALCFAKALGIKDIGEIDYAEREVSTRDGEADDAGRIDLLVSGKETVFFIENKVDAVLNNDLQQYLSFTRSISDGRNVFGVVLGRVGDGVKEGIYYLNYKTLIRVVERDIHTVIYTADKKCLDYFVDFIQNVKGVMGADMDFNEQFYKTFLKHEDVIFSIAENIQSMREYLKQKAREYHEIVRQIAPDASCSIWEGKNSILPYMGAVMYFDNKQTTGLKIFTDIHMSMEEGMRLELYARTNKVEAQKFISSIIPEDIGKFLLSEEGRYYSVKTYKLDMISAFEEEYLPILQGFLSKIYAKSSATT